MSALIVSQIQANGSILILGTDNPSSGSVKFETANDNIIFTGTAVGLNDPVAVGAYNLANSSAQLAFAFVDANGTQLSADSNTDFLIFVASANISIQGNSAGDNLKFDLVDTGVVGAIYGSGTDIANTASIRVDSKGRIVSIANTAGIISRYHTSDTPAINTAAQIQNWFPTLGNVTVSGGTTYWLDAALVLIDTATTHTQSIALEGTATFDWFNLDILHSDIANNATSISSSAASAIARMRWEGISLSTARILNATSTIGQHLTTIRGIIRTSAPGTLRPRFLMSAVGAPIAGYTGPTIKNGTYFILTPLTANTANAVGPWS